LSERPEIEKIAKSRPAEHGLPVPTWGLAKLADFPVTEGRVATTIITWCARAAERSGTSTGSGHLTCLDPVDDAGCLVDEADVASWGLGPQCRPRAG
jgi:hypothetical protein